MRYSRGDSKRISPLAIPIPLGSLASKQDSAQLPVRHVCVKHDTYTPVESLGLLKKRGWDGAMLLMKYYRYPDHGRRYSLGEEIRINRRSRMEGG